MPSVTLTLSQENLDRIVAALDGARKDDDSSAPDATPADVKAYVINKVKQLVAEQERREALRAAAVVTPVDID